MALALFDRASLIVHVGFDQAHLAPADWYTQTDHPYVQAVADILDRLAGLPYVEKLEFLVSAGTDPLTNLQVQLDREVHTRSQIPSMIFDHLETQKIYSFGEQLL